MATQPKFVLLIFLGIPLIFSMGFFCGIRVSNHLRKPFRRSNASQYGGFGCDPILVTNVTSEEFSISIEAEAQNISNNSSLTQYVVSDTFISTSVRRHNISALAIWESDLEDDQHAPEPAFCAKNVKCKSHCQSSYDVKTFLRTRFNFSMQSRRTPTIRIFVDKHVKTFHQEQPWQTQLALDRCSAKGCHVVYDLESANVVLCNLNAPSPRLPNVTYAVLNLEAHSYHSLPVGADNVMLVSFHPESELVINYGYTITHRMVVCLGQKISGQKCDNMEDPSTPFYKWCAKSFQGDVLTCIFNVMPHIARMNKVNKSAEEALAPTWISANCQRHNKYLLKLMKLIPIDSMASCYRTRTEQMHPGLQLLDHDGLWWGAGRTVANSSSAFRSYIYTARKIVIASHYWFFVSIENTIMDDYVTEKFYEGFLADTLMVYFGAPNARDYAPANHSFIHALDFAGPNQLADFLLALLEDRERYESYFWWKREVPAAISPRFREQMRLGLEHTNEDSMLCRLCTKLQQSQALNLNESRKT